MPKYENSVIYKIKHNEDYDDINIYVGSTTNFKNRKNCHKRRCNTEKDKKNYNSPVYQFIRNNGGWEEWVMIPIEQYSCNDKKELLIRERHHIDLLRPTLNKQIPSRTKEELNERDREYEKKYYKANKEQIAEKKKKYYENNKEYFKESFKVWYVKNGEIRNDKRKEKVICDHCGFESAKSNLKQHQKSKKCLKSQEDNVAR